MVQKKTIAKEKPAKLENSMQELSAHKEAVLASVTNVIVPTESNASVNVNTPTPAISKTKSNISVTKVASSFLKFQMEALLFSSGRTMTEEQLSLLAKVELPVVHKALAELQQDYASRESAITVYNDPTGWKMMIKEQYVGAVKHIVADTELTKACMETLAIIAYKYPKVLQSEVIEIRGSGAYEHMAELERLGFIRRDPEGRSYAVKLTDKFFSYFDVAGGKDIKEVFKNVKPKPKQEKPSQKTLGDLQVVDVSPTQVQKKLGQLEMDVVDVPGAQSGAKVQTEQVQNVVEDEKDILMQDARQDFTPHVSAADDAEQEKHLEIHNAFLDDLDRRIAAISSRNTVNEQDESLKRKPLPGSEQLNTESTDATEPNDPEGIDSEHEK